MRRRVGVVHTESIPEMSSDKPMELGIPPQKADPAKRFLTDPKAVTAWLEDLPLANIGETARLVYRALADLTHLEVPDLPRVRVAEELREAVRFLGRNLLPRYVDAAFPLPTKTRKIALLNREIHGELATAYKIVLLHQSKLPAPKLDRKLVALAAARALRYLQAVSLHSALIYEPPPPGTWREIHEIFEFIRRLGLDEVAVGDGVEPQPGSATPRDLYLRALLFSLVPPYRMRQRDMLSLADLLPAWAPLARLLPLSEARASSASVVVPTAADEPPSYRAANGKEPAAATYALITHEIGEVLRRMIEGSTAEPTQSLGALKASKSLLRQLIQAWGAGPTRRFVRTRLNFDLDLVIGMDNVHALLYSLRNRPDSDDQAVTPEQVEEDSVLEELTAFTASIRVDSEPSALDMSLAEDDSIFFFAQAPRTDTPPRVESAFAPTAAAKALPAEPPPTFHLRTINESAGGYCLSWAGGTSRRSRSARSWVCAPRDIRTSSAWAWCAG